MVWVGVGWQLASRHSLRVATDRCHSAARVQQPEPGSVTWWLLICHHPQTTCSLPCRAMAASDTLQLSLVRQSWASRSLSFDSHHEQRCPRPCHIKPAIPPRGASEVLPLRYQPPEQLCQGIHSAWICLEFCFFLWVVGPALSALQCLVPTVLPGQRQGLQKQKGWRGGNTSLAFAICAEGLAARAEAEICGGEIAAQLA